MKWWHRVACLFGLHYGERHRVQIADSIDSLEIFVCHNCRKVLA